MIMTNLTIKHFLQYSIVAGIVILSGLIGLSFVTNERINTETENLIRIDQTLLLDLNNMYANGLQTEQATRNVLLNPGDQKAKENYRNANEDFIKACDEAIKLSQDGMQERLRNIRLLWDEVDKLKTEVQQLAISDKKEEATALLVQTETPKWRSVRSELLGIIKVQKETFKVRIENIKNFMFKVKIVIATVSVISIVGCIGFYVILTKKIIGPLSNLTTRAESIARGDLSFENVDIKSADEVGILAEAINNMQKFLKEIIGNLLDTSGRLASTSEEFSTTVVQMTKRVEEQTMRASQVAAASTEMSQTVIDIARNASNISEAATDTSKTANEGANVVNKTVEEVQEIANTVEGLAQTMKSLGEKSKAIGKIVNVIKDIADQTNLLALNAAIEAARAGEQGKGFAVVSDEVRKLAEKTTNSAKEIGDMIAAIQQAAETAVGSMEEGSRKVSVGVDLATRAGASLNKILDSVSGLHSMVEQIAAATEEMSTVSEHISSDIEIVATVSKETATASGQINKEATNLLNLSVSLNHNMSKFRVTGRS